MSCDHRHRAETFDRVEMNPALDSASPLNNSTSSHASSLENESCNVSTIRFGHRNFEDYGSHNLPTNEGRHSLPQLLENQPKTAFPSIHRSQYMMPRVPTRKPFVVPTIAFSHRPQNLEEITLDVSVPDETNSNEETFEIADDVEHSMVEKSRLENDNEINRQSFSSFEDQQRRFSGNSRRCLKYRQKTRRRRNDNEKLLEMSISRNYILKAKYEKIDSKMTKLKDFYIKSLMERSFKCRRQWKLKNENPLVSLTEDGVAFINAEIKTEA